MNSICSVDTAHEDMIHDSQFDYYSTRLATCSSDRTIKVFDGKLPKCVSNEVDTLAIRVLRHLIYRVVYAHCMSNSNPALHPLTP